MQLSSAGLDLLRKSEGFRARTYLDACGLPTIGFGHRLRDRNAFPFGVNEDEAVKLLQSDVRTAEQAVEHLVKVPLTQGQFDALVDFVFNLGAGRLATSTLLRVLNASRYEDAAEHILQWDHAGGRELAALRTRRQAEVALWQAAEPVRSSAA